MPGTVDAIVLESPVNRIQTAPTNKMIVVKLRILAIVADF
jgi:hypothetical protein